MTLPLVLAVLLSLVIVKVCKLSTDFREYAIVQTLGMWAVALLFWPVVWSHALGEETLQKPHIWMSLVWPMIVILWDTFLLCTTTYEQHTQPRRSLSMDSHTICSLTFALAGIFRSAENKHLFVSAILGCMIFMMPPSTTNVDPADRVLLESVQKIVLTFSTGFLLAGIISGHQVNA